MYCDEMHGVAICGCQEALKVAGDAFERDMRALPV